MEEAAEAARRFSGHSWRAGYATSAADADIPSYRIQRHCRHASADMTARYIRISQAWSKSGLKGILRRPTGASAQGS
jgi:integrase